MQRKLFFYRDRKSKREKKMLFIPKYGLGGKLGGKIFNVCSNLSVVHLTFYFFKCFFEKLISFVNEWRIILFL
jgi:hypothetical protein